MIKARYRGLGAADPFTRGYDLLGEQLSPAQLQALRLAPQHASRTVSSNPETQIDDSGCRQALEAADYYGALPEQRGAMLAACQSQGIESFMLSAESAGLDSSAMKPWYKKPATWVLAGAALLLGVVVVRRVL